LTQADALEALEAYRAQPFSNPLGAAAAPGAFDLGTLAPLQKWALKRIGQRFGTEVLHRDQGLVVVALKPRR
jgi:hypothetical protein